MSVRAPFVVALLLSLTLLYPRVSLSNEAPQDSVVFRDDVERLFEEGISRFRANRYQAALERFTRIVKDFAESQRATAASLMAAKSHYHLGAYQPAEQLLLALLRDHPTSQYVDDAHYTLGLCYLQSGQYEEASIELLRVRGGGGESRLREQAGLLLRALASNYLTIPQLRRVIQLGTDEDVRASLTVALAEKVLVTGDVSGAKQLLVPMTRLSKQIDGVTAASDLLKKIERSGVLKVGVVLPLMLHHEQRGTRELGTEMLDGIRFAADQHNLEAMPKVNLEIRDSERDVGIAARQVSELTMDGQILAIVGPIFSNEVAECARIANSRGVPLITPTATSDGLAAIGEFVFQANPDFSVRARAVAEYAFDRQGARRFAVVAPTDTAGKIMAAAFQAEVIKLGGEMIDFAWYEPGETDLRSQLSGMRRRALEKAETYSVSFSPKMKPVEVKRMSQWGVPQHVLDSLIERSAMASVEFLFGASGRRVADSLRIPYHRMRARYDSLGVPVTNIDALFLPISSPAEIGVVCSQLRYFNFQTQLLGTGNWYDANELEQNRQYANGVVFTTDAYVANDDPGYLEFADRFQLAFQYRPTENTLFGYDAMGLLLKVVRQGATHREEVVSALSRIRKFEGIHSKISFDEGRVNSYLTILQYRNRLIRKIAEIDVGRKGIITVE